MRLIRLLTHECVLLIFPLISSALSGLSFFVTISGHCSFFHLLQLSSRLNRSLTDLQNFFPLRSVPASSSKAFSSEFLIQLSCSLDISRYAGRNLILDVKYWNSMNI